MKKLSLLATAAALFISASAAYAAASNASQNFVKNAAIGGDFEVESSRLALQKSQNADVRQFAQQMITDHTKASAQLKATLPSSSVSPSAVPTALDAGHQQRLDKLKAASGASFDREYLADQRAAHDEAVSLFRDYASSGDDRALKNFATQTLPTLELHQQHVKQLSAL